MAAFQVFADFEKNTKTYCQLYGALQSQRRKSLDISYLLKVIPVWIENVFCVCIKVLHETQLKSKYNA